MYILNIIRILLGLFLTIIVVLTYVSLTHPILSKWIFGSARIIGKPINATVYADGKLNNEIKVFHSDDYWDGEKCQCYILSLKKFDRWGMLRFINIDLKENWIGRPNSTSLEDYEIIDGILFQSDVAYLSTNFKDDQKGYNFEPTLTFNNKEIKFNIPPNQLKFNSDKIKIAGI